MKFTRIEAQFVHDFVNRHPLAIAALAFTRCSFQSDDGCVDILKDCLHGLRTEVAVVLRSKDDVSAPWFPSLADFTTLLCVLCNSPLGDDSDFRFVSS